MKQPLDIEQVLKDVQSWKLEPMEAEETEAVLQLFSMTPAELDKIPFDIILWRCKIKCCKHTTRVRDYGVRPYFYHTRFGWINQIHNFFLCGGHTKAYKTRWNSDNEKTPLRKFWGGNDTVKPEIIY